MNIPTVQELVVPHGQGERTSTDMVIKARTARLGGDFSIMHGEVRAKELLAPHTHAHEDQAVYLLSGSLEFEVGGADGLLGYSNERAFRRAFSRTTGLTPAQHRRKTRSA